ncbi:MAG: hypothetical protein LIO74_08915 [Ruminococcus sp.]|nr:hypothetical protein [Ruminococcus sp.]
MRSNYCFSTLNKYEPVSIETAHIFVEFADNSVKEWKLKDYKFEQYSGALILIIKPDKKKVLKGQVKDENKNAKFSFVDKEDEENVADEVVRIYGLFVDPDYLCVFDFNWTDNKYIYEKHTKDKKGFHIFDIFNLVSNKNNNLISEV